MVKQLTIEEGNGHKLYAIVSKHGLSVGCTDSCQGQGITMDYKQARELYIWLENNIDNLPDSPMNQ